MSRKLPIIFFSLLFFAWSLGAQARYTVELPAHERMLTQSVNLGEGPFYAFYVVAEEAWSELTLEHSADGVRWTPARELLPDPHAGDRPVSTWVSVPAGERWYRIRRSGGGALRLHWYNPGHTPESARTSVAVADPAFSTCPCALPAVLPRTEWCPGGDCPRAGSPAATEVTHLIIHHSAGTNNADDWAAIVRVIYELHVTGNGWDDVGYNYLIDPNGVIYEGRGNDVRGAHFCGSNTGTMGVCVLGTFTNVAPSDAARAALATLLAWKSCDRDLDPLGSAYHAASELTLPRISGHRQGCATACPGDAFYPLLPQVRQATAAAIDACATVDAADPTPEEEAWRVFPNPTRASLTLSGPGTGATSVALIDLTGRRVRRWAQVDPGETLSLAGLPAGQYRLRVGNAGVVLPVVVY